MSRPTTRACTCRAYAVHICRAYAVHMCRAYAVHMLCMCRGYAVYTVHTESTVQHLCSADAYRAGGKQRTVCSASKGRYLPTPQPKSMAAASHDFGQNSAIAACTVQRTECCTMHCGMTFTKWCTMCNVWCAMHCNMHCNMHCTMHCTMHSDMNHVLCCTALHCDALCCTMLHYAALCCTALHCAALCCTVLHYALRSPPARRHRCPPRGCRGSRRPTPPPSCPSTPPG